MKRKNRSFYIKCQSNILLKTAFLRSVTHSIELLPKCTHNLADHQKIALITNLNVWITDRSFTVLPS